MTHRGEIIKQAVYKSGYPITKLAEALGKSRRWVYQMFENNNVNLDVVLQIGDIIHYDFSNDIEDLNKANFNLALNTNASYNTKEQSAEYWKNKYILLLEEYTELLKRSNAV